jgi:hypothetical protein
MTQPQLEKDVANYVLAYLARQGYRNTMSKFLQECNLLPPNTTMMVLPETPLSDIVAEYNARKQSTLMLEKLGPKASWKALWEKLEHYLSQLRMLADTLLGSHQYNVGRKRPCRTRAPELQKFTAPPEPESHSDASNPPSQASSSTVPTQPGATPISGPRKSKLVCLLSFAV